MKIAGIVLLAIGILMIIYTGFNYFTKETLVDIGPIEITRQKKNIVQWPPVVGAVLLVGGIILLFMSKKGSRV